MDGHDPKCANLRALPEGNGEDIRGEVDFDECVKQADLALYETKRSNKGKFTVYNYPPPAKIRKYLRLGAA